MKLKLFSLFTALLMVGCGKSSQPSEDADTTDTAPNKNDIDSAPDVSKLQVRNKGLYYLQNTDKPFTGYAKESWSNGQVQRLYQFKDGKQDGRYTLWYKNGQKQGESIWKDGKRVGDWTMWRMDGSEYKSKATYSLRL